MADEPLPEQAAFIEVGLEASALLAAGPGTGKTWVLERRSEHLVANGVDPEAIATLTLTRSLARQLSERIPHGHASTLHAFALAHLNRVGDAWGKRVVDPWELKEIVRHDLQLGHAVAFTETDVPDLWAVKRFLKKLGAAFHDNQEEPANLSPTEKRLRQVFLKHRDLFQYRLMDELAYDLVRLIENGHALVGAPSHVLVDEYQDLTAGELLLLQLLWRESGAAINACGDDRQSIYGFREADALALHRFPAVYGSGDPKYLWRSSRCPAGVCSFANDIADALPGLPGLERPPLEPWPGRADDGTVELLSFPSPIGEARGIVARCKQLLDDEVPEGDIVVVVSSFYGPVMADLLRAADEAGGPRFYDPRAGSSVSSTLAVRLLVTSLRLVVDNTDQMAWRRLLYETPKGRVDNRLRVIFSENEATFLGCLERVGEIDGVVETTLRAGRRIIDTFAEADDLNPNEVVALAADALGLTEVDMEPLRAFEADPPSSAKAWIQRVFEASELEDEEEQIEQDSAIAVHTVFSAKGLEAPHVFVMNALTQSFAGRGNPADGIRLAYVAATRASKTLTVSAPRWLQGTRIGNMIESNVGGLAALMTDAGAAIGVGIQVIE